MRLVSPTHHRPEGRSTCFLPMGHSPMTSRFSRTTRQSHPRRLKWPLKRSAGTAESTVTPNRSGTQSPHWRRVPYEAIGNRIAVTRAPHLARFRMRLLVKHERPLRSGTHVSGVCTGLPVEGRLQMPRAGVRDK